LFSGELSSHNEELSGLRLGNEVLSFGGMNRWDLGFL
jgi:hypothetical protein